MGFGTITRRIYGARHYAPAALLRDANVAIDFAYSPSTGDDDWMGADPRHSWPDCVEQYNQARAKLLSHGMPDPGPGAWFDVEDYD